MGYACPVCETPQSDAEHLANHLAFTAMLGDGDHESWLDERVPEWEDLGPAELAPEVTECADEEEYPRVFEDTTGQDHDHGHEHEHDHGQGHGVSSPGGRGPGGVDLGDPDAYDTEADPENVLEEARELTRRRRAGGGEGGSGEKDSSEEDGDADGDEERGRTGSADADE